MRLTTQNPSVELRVLCERNADSIHSLIQQNREHLTQRGDYEDLVAASIEELRSELAGDDRSTQFGTFLDGALVGNVTLIRHQPTVYGLGYWISGEHAGCGIMTDSIRAVAGYATNLGASEIWAGITPSNARSIRLVERLGFELARTQDTHLSYRLTLAGGI
ncbi:MAG: GNAT family protein [Gammaproteobacteria bacterium]|nr:GNAT family protein [Gammaproteobacteria bacterium]